jgi:hypothetical protein
LPNVRSASYQILERGRCPELAEEVAEVLIARAAPRGQLKK